jgi:hypothetical protein
MPKTTKDQDLLKSLEDVSLIISLNIASGIDNLPFKMLNFRLVFFSFKPILCHTAAMNFHITSNWDNFFIIFLESPDKNTIYICKSFF